MAGEKPPISRWSFKNPKSGKKIQVFLVCVFISTFIWFTRELSKDASSTVSVPIEFVALDDSLVVTSSNVEAIEVTLNASGFGLFGQRAKGGESLEIPLRQASKAGNVQYSETQLVARIQELIGNEVSIASIVPDHLIVEIEQRVTRSIKVVAELDYQTSSNFFIEPEYQITPELVRVSGPKSILDTLTFLRSETAVARNVESSITSNSALIIPPGLSASHSEIELTVQVDQWTEKTLRLPISTPETEQEFKIRTYPDSVDVTFQLGLKIYDEIDSGDFSASLLVNSPDDLHTSFELEVAATCIRTDIRNISVSPAKVEFILLH